MPTLYDNNYDSFEEPNFDLHQLVSAELFSPEVDETLWFFEEILGMTEVQRDGNSVYLRAFEDWYQYSLKVTYRESSGTGQTVWRTSAPAALSRRVDAIEQYGIKGAWNDGDFAQGPTYSFTDTAGHHHSLLWDLDYYQAPSDQRSDLLSRPQKRPTRGIPVRRLDHVNHLVDDVTTNREFLRDTLGFRLRENIVDRHGREGAAWMSVSPLVHEIANLGDQSGQSANGSGRLHHLAFWYGYPQHLDDLADLCVENGIEIEAGPGKHGISQAKFLYVLEPGGNRIELFGDAGYLIFDPDWKPVTWTEENVDKAVIWYGSPLPTEYFLYGTPNSEPSNYRTPNTIM